MDLIDDFISLIFPRICAACGNPLLKKETIICLSCEYHLPRTNYHLYSENPVNQILLGRIPLENCAAFLHFNKGNIVQKLIHQLKYKGRKDIGIYLGKQYGLDLKSSLLFQSVQIIIPVPLHTKRMKQRGYNQSEQFAIGLGETMNILVHTNALFRNKETETQTKKSRFLRWKNVKEVFMVSDIKSLEMKHILLVDDVITTGATIESCVNTLLQVPGIRISVVAIAATA